MLRRQGYNLLKLVRTLVGPSSAILCFHAIGNDHPRHITRARFHRIVNGLVEEFQTSTVGELQGSDGNEPLSSPTVALTFDDGYRSHFKYARPILKERNVRGTFYVPTNFIGGSFPASDDDHPTLSRGQLRTLHAGGHEIGSHSHSHHPLQEASPARIRQELQRSKSILEDLTGTRITSLAYPSGRYDQTTVEIAREVGYRTAVTTSGRTLRLPLNRFELPRITVSNQLSLDELKVKLSPLNRVVRWVGEFL